MRYHDWQQPKKRRGDWLAAPIVVGAATIAASIFGAAQLLAPYVYPPAGSPAPVPSVTIVEKSPPAINVAPPIVNVAPPVIQVLPQTVVVPQKRSFKGDPKASRGKAFETFLNNNKDQYVHLDLFTDQDSISENEPIGDSRVTATLTIQRTRNLRDGGFVVNFLDEAEIRIVNGSQHVRGFFKVVPIAGYRQGFYEIALEPVTQPNITLESER